MKKYYCVVLVLCLVCFAFTSCEKDEENNDNDKSELNDKLKFSQWISVNGNDSIVLDFWHEDYDYIFIKSYTTEKGIIKETSVEFYHSWSVKNNHLNFLGSDYSIKNSYLFDLKGDEVTLYKFKDNKDFRFLEIKEDSYKKLDNKFLEGVWGRTFSKEYVEWVFENNEMKQYTYEKENGKLINYKLYDTYYLYRSTLTYNGKTFLKDEFTAYNKNNYENDNFKRLFVKENNQLKVYTKYDLNPVVYTKVQ